MKIITCPHLSQFTNIAHGFCEADPTFSPEQSHITIYDQRLPLITLNQIHGTIVYKFDTPPQIKKEGDGLVTSSKGIALGILTADCGPVLFYDPQANIIGACHAGWKGAKAGILQATIDEMEKLGAQRSNLYATLGPTIQQQNYEVGPEFPDLIGEGYSPYFKPSEKEGHHYFDLPLYICNQLVREGIPHVTDLKCDTFSGNFYSRRKLTGQVYENKKVNNLSLIAIL